MSEFEELKVQAKELGVKIHGLKTAELKVAVEAAKIARDANPVPAPSDIDPMGNDQTLPVATKPTGLTPAAIKASEPAIEKTFNAVIIMNGKQEIRTYSLAIHGKGFADLATSFASERGYTMELVDTGKNITCPHCGQSFAPKK